MLPHNNGGKISVRISQAKWIHVEVFVTPVMVPNLAERFPIGLTDGTRRPDKDTERIRKKVIRFRERTIVSHPFLGQEDPDPANDTATFVFDTRPDPVAAQSSGPLAPLILTVLLAGAELRRLRLELWGQDQVLDPIRHGTRY